MTTYHPIQIGNDSPVWLKPRRTVWFLHRNGKIVCDQAGRRRFFKTYSEACAALARGVRNGSLKP